MINSKNYAKLLVVCIILSLVELFHAAPTTQSILPTTQNLNTKITSTSDDDGVTSTSLVYFDKANEESTRQNDENLSTSRTNDFTLTTAQILTNVDLTKTQANILTTEGLTTERLTAERLATERLTTERLTTEGLTETETTLSENANDQKTTVEEIINKTEFLTTVLNSPSTFSKIPTTIGTSLNENQKIVLSSQSVTTIIDEPLKNETTSEYMVSLKTTTATTTAKSVESRASIEINRFREYRSEEIHSTTKTDEASTKSFHSLNSAPTVTTTTFKPILTSSTLQPLTITLADQNDSMTIKSSNTKTIVEETDDNTDSEIEKTAFANLKKKVNGIVMGHDGVKVTRKKQLIEKHFKDESYENVNEDKQINKINSEKKVILPKQEEKLKHTEKKTPKVIKAPNHDENKQHLHAVKKPGLFLGPVILHERNLGHLEKGINIGSNIFNFKSNSTQRNSTELPTFTSTLTETHTNFKEKSSHSHFKPEYESISMKGMTFGKFNAKDFTKLKPHTEEITIISHQNSHVTTDHSVKPTEDLPNESSTPSFTSQSAVQPETLTSFKNIMKATQLPDTTNSRIIENQTGTPGIEIQINVSEGLVDAQRNHQTLEFLFKKINSKDHFSTRTKLKKNESQDVEFITFKPANVIRNDNDFSNESDILVVEITDDISGGNDSTITNENLKFSLPHDRKYDLNSIKSSKNSQTFETQISKNYHPETSSYNDDLFVPNLKLEPGEEVTPITTVNSVQKQNSKESDFDRDSDTIFYISNTEVKVVESKPTSNTLTTNHKSSTQTDSNLVKPQNQLHHFPSLVSQLFPSIYEEDVIIDFPSKNSSEGNSNDFKSSERYEEDIILSPLKNNFDPLKALQSVGGSKLMNDKTKINNLNLKPTAVNVQNKPAASDEVSYVGESFIEIEETPNIDELSDTKQFKLTTTTVSPVDGGGETSMLSNVIIQPAIIPEMSIGIPVIGELPPQIQLQEIDFMSSGSKDVSAGNDDGIQYGGDLIANGHAIGIGYDIDSDFNYINGRKNRNGNAVPDSQIIMHAVGNMQKDQLIADLPSSSDGRAGTKDIPLKRNLNNNINSTMPEKLGNATAYSVFDDNEGDFNFSDVQTLLLACFTTLVPLVLLAMMGYAVRFLWIKYARHERGLIGDTSTDPLADKSQNDLKSTESGITINRSNDTLESNSEIIPKYENDYYGGGGGSGGRGNGYNGQSLGNCGPTTIEGYTATMTNGNCVTNNYETNNQSKDNLNMNYNKINHCGANGSVTTMTLKNNHLIVETEERDDMSRDARETKMHYTSSEKDGVFVIEVSRGADSKEIPSPRESSPARACIIDTTEKPENQSDGNEFKSSSNNEEVQIHQPPSDGNNEDENNENDDESEINDNNMNVNLGNSNIGLSQSDLSSSSEDSNKRYSYGNQQLYEANSKYDDEPNMAPVTPVSFERSDSEPLSNGNDDDKSPERIIKNDNNVNTKPVIKAALLKQDTVIENKNYKANGEKELQNDENNSDNEQNSVNNKKYGHIENGTDEKLIENNGHQTNGNIETINNENEFDSIISLPAPPSTEEIKQMNDVVIMDSMQLDSLPPPPPPTEIQDLVNSNGTESNGHSTNEKQNGIPVVTVTGSS